MSLDQTRDGLSRREALGLGLAGLLTSLRPKSAGARTDDEKRSARIFFFASRKSARNEPGGTGIFAVDPENDSWQFVVDSRISASVSHDGKKVGYLDTSDRDRSRRTIRLLDLETGETKFLSALHGSIFWSSDDRYVIVSGQKTPQDALTETWRIDVADSTKKTRLPIDENDRVFDWSPDEKFLLVVKRTDEPGKKIDSLLQCPVHLLDLAGKDLGRVLAGETTFRHWYFRFSRDGKHIVYLRHDIAKAVSECRAIAVDGKDDRLLLKAPEKCSPFGPALWSPNGKRIAASYSERAKATIGKSLPEVVGYRIEVADADGSNRRRVALPEDFQGLRLVDWR